MIHKSHQSSIITKISISVSSVFLTAIFLLLLGITGFNSYWMKQRILADKQEFVTEISRSINDQFRSLTVPLQSLGNLSAVHRLLTSDSSYDSDWLTDIHEIETNLSNIHIYYDYIVDLVIIDMDSKILFSLTNALSRNYDYINSDWFQDALSQPSALKYAPPHGIEHYSRNQERYSNVFSIIYPVSRSGSTEGYILCEISADKISSLFSSNVRNPSEGYLMVDADGLAIYDYKLNRSESEVYEIWSSLYSGGATDRSLQTIRNHNLYTSKQIESTGWYIISETPSAVINNTLWAIWFYAVLIGAIAVLFSIFLLRYIMRRLQESVGSVIQRISSYDGTAPVSFDEEDNCFREITVIRSKFEEMAGKINSLINDVYIAQMHRKDMELEMLVSQVNPHFLYNVLQTIHGEAVLHGDREIEDMLSALGEIMHYTIDHSHETTTIAQEIQHVKNYLSFYKRRFPQLFVYTIDCPEELLNHTILKYLLQPIIENSIKHGFRDRKSGCEIRLRIFPSEGNILFEVCDNGHGIPPERMEEIKKDMEYALRNSSIGISNTNARIKLKYGTQYGITISSEVEQYTRILITIPDIESRD